MAKMFIGGASNIELYVGDQLYATADTATTSSITTASTAVDVRGGMGAKLIGKFYHSGKMEVKIEDPLFRLEYIAKQVGSVINIGGDAIITEEVTIGAANKGSVQNTPSAWGEYGAIGWYRLTNSEEWNKINFIGKEFTAAGVSQGTKVCVKYAYFNTAAKKIVVPANIIPQEVKLVMKAQLFAGEEIKGATKIGVVQVVIPRFKLSGAVNLSMDMTGTSKTNLDGEALAVSSTGSCEDSAYYAEMTVIENNANWFDSVYAISNILDPISLSSANTTYTLDIRALASSAVPFKPPYQDLLFTSSDPTKATVTPDGTITRVAAGNCNVEIKIVGKPTIIDTVNVVIA